MLTDSGVMTKAQAKSMLEFAQRRVETEGVHERLPLYVESLAPRIAPEWMEQYGEKMAGWQEDVGKAFGKWQGDIGDWYKTKLGAEQWNVERAFQERQFAESQRRWNIEDYQQRQSLAIEAERNRMAAVAGRAQGETNRLQAWAQGGGVGWEGSQTPQNEQMFERMRQQLLGNLTGPRNWVNRQRIEQAENPYTPQGIDWSTKQIALKEDVGRAKALEKQVANEWLNMAKREVDAGPMVDNRELYQVQQAYENARTRREGLERQQAEVKQEASEAGSGRKVAAATGGGFDWYGEPDPYPAGWRPPEPTLPGDVTQFVKGGKYGKPVEILGYKDWQRAPWATKERVIGYGESLGQYPEQILEQVEARRRMLPKTPRAPSSWRAARQI